jgi:hypothetical protein
MGKPADAIPERQRPNAWAVENENTRTDGITENKGIIIPLPAVALPQGISII